MPWSAGLYTRWNTTNVPPYWVGDASVGLKIEASRHDTQDADFEAGINQCLNKDGSNVVTGNLNLNTNKLTHIGAGTLRTDAAQVAQVQDGTSSYLGTTGGTSTAFTVTATPTITALVTGAQYRFKANAANGVAATLKVDGTTATTMQRQGTALVGNEFKANDIVTVVYDGTNFQITNIATAPLYVDRTNNHVGIGGASRNLSTKLDVKGIIACGSGTSDSEVVWTRPTVADSSAWHISVRTDVGGSNEDLKVLRFIGNTYQSISMQIQNSTGHVAIGAAPLSTARLYVRSATADAFSYVYALENSALASLGYVRSDGLWNTGNQVGSPYNNILGVGANTYVGSDGTLYRAVSSIKYKTDVKDYDKGLAELLTLRSVYYKDKTNPSAQYAGLIAEEVLEAGMPEFIQYAADNTPDGLSYGHMMSLAVNSIKELNAKVEALEARIAALEA